MTRKRLLIASLLAFGVTLTTFASADTPAPSASAPPPLPGYFSGANAEGKPATWPDPTGAAAGVWESLSAVRPRPSAISQRGPPAIPLSCCSI